MIRPCLTGSVKLLSLQSQSFFKSATVCLSRTMAATVTPVPQTNLSRHDPHPLLVWVDCEMTGLNISEDILLEVAVIITDADLEEVATLGPLVIKTDPEILSKMNKWCLKNHKKSGLYDECLKSQVTMEDVDKKLYEFLVSRNINIPALAGNSISYDRQFLEKCCPKFASLLHYRLLDVSSVKECIRYSKL